VPLRVAVVLPYGVPVQVSRTTSAPASLLVPRRLLHQAARGARRRSARRPERARHDRRRSPDPAERVTLARLVGTRRPERPRSDGGDANDPPVPGRAYVPIDLTALTVAGLTGEVTLQMKRGGAAEAQPGSTCLRAR